MSKSLKLLSREAADIANIIYKRETELHKSLGWAENYKVKTRFKVTFEDGTTTYVIKPPRVEVML